MKRHVVLFGLIFGVLGLGLLESPAQTPKTNSKKEEAKEPKEPKEPKDEPKPPDIKWPREILGKNLETWVRLMKESKDASTRDQAIRTIPLFGPDAQKVASANLVNAIKRDPDINVRLAALATVPLIGFETSYVDDGLNSMVHILTPSALQPNHTRYEATLALGNCGPIAKRAIPTLATYTIIDPTSWTNRKAAATALGQVGQPLEKDAGPDVVAIEALIKALRSDTSHQVRREALNALLQLGPPIVEKPWRDLRAALTSCFLDNDKNIALWARVAFIKTEQTLIKPSDPNLKAIMERIVASDVIIKQQKEIEAGLTKLADSTDQAVKDDALEKKQTAIQVRNEALQLKRDAIQALGIIGEESKPRLDDLIAIAQGKEEEPIIIATAVWAMAQIPSESAKTFPVIDPLRRAENATIKQTAESAYKTLTDIAEKDKKLAPPKP